MRRNFLFLAIIILAAISCGGNKTTSTTTVKASDLLCTVPSRSLAVMHFNNTGKALEILLDSTSVFRSIDYGELAESEMVLSYDYGAALIPLLAISTGKTSADTLEAVKQVLEQLPALKLKGYYYNDTLVKHSALLISPSQAAITEAESHIGAETSVLEAPDFEKAVALAKGSAGTVYLRNTSASRWVPKTLLQQFVPRKKLVNFVTNAAEWMVANFHSYKTEDIDIQTIAENQRYFMKVLESCSGADSHIKEVLPASTDWMVDLPLKDWKAYYDAYSLFLDTNSILTAHENALRSAKNKYGKNPLDWAKELNPKEIALVHWDGRQVLLLNVPKAKIPQSITENPHPGYTGLLFGGVFALEDESSCANLGSWLVVGAGEDVAEFALCEEKAEDVDLPSKDCKFAVYTPEALMFGKGSGIELNMY